MAGDAKNDGGWVGRSIRRLEDPTLVAGRGRFTGDLPAARWVRFVRSPVASGRIKRIVAPSGATIVTAAELAAVKPIQPLLHKFNYVPISQPVLARDVVRFVGEPIAAVVSSAREEAEDVADLVEVEIEEVPAVVGAGAARGACGMGHRQRAHHAHLRDADAACDAHRYRRSHWNAGSGSAGDRPRRWRRLRAEDVAGGGIRGRDLARAQAQDVGGVGRGPAREPRRLLPQPRQSIVLEGAFDVE